MVVMSLKVITVGRKSHSARTWVRLFGGLCLVAISVKPAFAQSIDERNLNVLRTIYTKIRNQFTLGDNPFGANESFFIMCNPGITLDPNWDLTQLPGQEKLARLLGRAPKASWLYRPSSTTIESIYGDVVNSHSTGSAKLTASEKKNLADALAASTKLLYRNSKFDHTQLYDNYLATKQAYEHASFELSKAMAAAEASGTPLDPQYRTAADAARQAFEGPQGRKAVVEGALENYSQITKLLNPSSWWDDIVTRYRERRPTGTSGKFGRILLDQDYKRLFDDDGWTSITITDADVSQTSYHEHTTMGIGGSAGWGLWSAQLSGEYQEDKERQFSDVKGFSITMDVRVVGVTYPWMETNVFHNRGWRWLPGSGLTRLSDGGQVPIVTPSGRLPMVPSMLILSRNVIASGSWNTNEINTYSSKVSARLACGWGPHSISGKYSKAIESGTQHGQITNNGFTAPDVQVIGFFCDVLPRSPFPDGINLDWTPALTPNDIDGGGFSIQMLKTLRAIEVRRLVAAGKKLSEVADSPGVAPLIKR